MRSFQVTAGFILLVFAAMALYGLGDGSLWQDEGWDMYVAAGPWPDSFHTSRDIAMHPPFHHVMLHYWTVLFGASVFSARMPSVLGSLAALLSVLWGTRLLLGPRVALVAATLLALSSRFLISTQEIRVHPIHAFVYTATVFAIALALARPDRRKVALACVGLLAVSLVDQWGPILMVGANLLVLVQYRRLKVCGFPFGAWCIGQVPAVIASSFEVVHLFRVRHSLTTLVFAPPHTVLDYPKALYYLAAGTAHEAGAMSNAGVVVPTIAATVLLVAGVLALLWRARHEEEDGAGRGLVTLLALTLLPWAASEAIYAVTGTSLFSERRLGFTAPLLACVAAVGVVALWDARPRALGRGGVLACLAILLAYNAISTWHWYTDPRYQRQDWRGATKWLASRLQPGDAVVLQNGYSHYVFRYYMGPALPVYTLEPRDVPMLPELLRRHGRIWYVNCLAFISDPRLEVVKGLTERAGYFEDAVFDNLAQPDARIVVVGFRSPSAASPPGAPAASPSPAPSTSVSPSPRRN